MNDLDAIRKTSAKYLTYFVFCNIPLFLLVGLVLQSPGLWYAVVGGVILSGVCFFSNKTAGENQTSRMLIASCIALSGALFVSLFSGHMWQIDSHFYFFAAIAFCIVLSCPMSLLACAGVIALHHLSLNFIAPNLIFPDGTDTFRVIFHALFVLVETGFLVYFAARIANLFTEIEAAKEETATALAAAEDAARESEVQREAASKAADAAMKAHQEAEEARAAQDDFSANKEVEADAQRRQLASGFKNEIGGIIDQISNAAVSLNDNSQAIINQASVGQDGLSAVTEATNEAAMNVQTVAASAEELAASVAEIAQQVATANETADNAVKRSRETNKQVSELSSEADNIGTVVSLIQDIAEQTNLLALNATIEAARAGEAGKGFAVVASEVKSLANQSAQAAEDIYSRISSMQNATSTAVTSIGEITTIIENLSAGSVAIAAAVEEQDAATREIARSATRASDGTKDASDAVSSISTTVQETLQMSGTLSDLAHSFSQLVEQLQTGSENFVNRMQS